MRAMFFRDYSRERRALALAIAASLAIHAIALLIPSREPAKSTLPPLSARLVPRAQQETPVVQSEMVPSAKTPPQASPRLLSTRNPRGRPVAQPPKFSAAEKKEMNDFLEDLDKQVRAKPKRTLAQRSRAMAR